MFCTKCGKQIIDPEGQFCANCGGALFHNNDKEENQNQNTSQHNSTCKQTPPIIWATSVLSYIISAFWTIMTLINIIDLYFSDSPMQMLNSWIVLVTAFCFVISFWIYRQKSIGYYFRLGVCFNNVIISIVFLARQYNPFRDHIIYILFIVIEMVIFVMLLTGTHFYNIKKRLTLAKIAKTMRSVRYLLQLHQTDFDDVPEEIQDSEENNEKSRQ